MSDPIICTCMEITKSQIEQAIIEKKLKTIESVQDETTAGTVCGACVDDIYLMLEEINGSVEL
jgi:bacterioferritin-associated ferredoxin